MDCIEKVKAERDRLREAIRRHRAAGRLGERSVRDQELYRALATPPREPEACRTLYVQEQHFTQIDCY